METGYDILFFWVARMMMLGEWLTGKAPFSIVLLSGLIRDPEGKKMSKTKGNSVDPLGTIDEIGADALRFALNNGTGPGSDLRLTASRLDGARNFANKLWNAGRFVLGARPDSVPENESLVLPVAGQLGPAEHWILNRCAETTSLVEEAYSTFQFGEAARLLHHAIWSEYCDWYLELAKVQLSAESPAEVRKATWEVLAWVLDNYLRLLHPFMPFVTEAIWDRLPSRVTDRDLLMTSRWPDAAEARGVANRDTAAALAKVISLVGAVRTARSDAGVDPALMMDARVFVVDPRLRDVLGQVTPAVARLGRVRLAIVDSRDALDDTAAGTALAVLSEDAEARLVADATTREQERNRLLREQAETQRLLEQARARLADENFVQRAPAQVVDGARERLAELEERAERLRERLGEGNQTDSR
jgi:valyl-tRNA synthetase